MHTIVFKSVAAAAALTALSAGQVQASTTALRWSADPRDGIGAFKSIQCDSKTFATGTDSVKGAVWTVTQPAKQERCEAVGPDVSPTESYYLGWSSKFSIGDSESRYFFQVKSSPSSGTANHPVVIGVINGELQLHSWTTDHKDVLLWRGKAVKDQWNDYALRITSGKQDGTVQFWFNGTRQRLLTGSETYTGTTYDGTRTYLKWGIYHPAPGVATSSISTIKMGSSLADVTAK
ncbi:heparin lyase I family protein [Amycolatopsis sp. NPDC059657]|uniref:heparin lyase I family protein n=1 Tax=Amycolatopsis sp. NPDC059657 TaxID=3346899 RepID=UPI00366C6273